MTLAAADAGIADAAGNALDTDASVGWETEGAGSGDTTPPEVVEIRHACEDPVLPPWSRAPAWGRRNAGKSLLPIGWGVRGWRWPPRPQPFPPNQVRFTVLFSEEVTGVNAADFDLRTWGWLRGRITDLATEDSVAYTVTVGHLRGTGKVRLDVVDDDSIRDLAGNPLGGEGSANGDFMNGDVVKIRAGHPWQPGWPWQWLQGLFRQLFWFVGQIDHWLQAAAPQPPSPVALPAPVRLPGLSAVRRRGASRKR